MIYAVKTYNVKRKNCSNRGKNVNHVTKNYRCFKDFNIDEFVKDLSNVDWNVHDLFPINHWSVINMHQSNPLELNKNLVLHG